MSGNSGRMAISTGQRAASLALAGQNHGAPGRRTAPITDRIFLAAARSLAS